MGHPRINRVYPWNQVNPWNSGYVSWKFNNYIERNLTLTNQTKRKKLIKKTKKEAKKIPKSIKKTAKKI
jgi:ABC-type transport system substrate-binding protein